MSRRLTKSRTNKVLTGTLAGIAEYFRIDPTIVRIVYVVIALLGWGMPFLLYIVLAILIPKAPGGPTSTDYYYKKNQYKRPDGHPYYTNNTPPKRKEAKKVDDDDWSDF